jgi:hypothetical protein
MPEAAVKLAAVLRAKTATIPTLSSGNLFDEEEDDESLASADC